MTEKLATLNKMFWNSILDEALKFFIVGTGYTVPELRSAVMIKIDATHVEILNVPSKHRSKSAYIQIRSVDTAQYSFAQRISFNLTLVLNPENLSSKDYRLNPF